MYTAVKDLEWANEERTLVKCLVNFAHVDFEEWSPFCADPNDTFAPYAKDIFDRAVSGEFGTIKEYVALPDQESLQTIPVVDVSAGPAQSNDLAQEVERLKQQVALLLQNQSGV